MLFALVGCASLATQGIAHNLRQAIVNQDDPATVKAGAPAYMLMLDGLIHEHPDDQSLLFAGADLYSTYASVFVNDVTRARRLADRAFAYARRGVCLHTPALCSQHQLGHDQFIDTINTMQTTDVPVLFSYATTWLAWILANSTDWNAIADLPRVEILMQRVVMLDEKHERGQAHLYLGMMHTRLPAAMGGRPAQGRKHFERAIELSDGRNLIAKVEYARRYARMTFDRELHDRLLREVTQADPVEPGLTLSNTLAQQQAHELLAAAAGYFQE